MKNALFIASLLFVAFTFTSCEKETSKDKDKKQCEINHTGSLILSNYQDDPYKVFVNGVDFGILQPNQTSSEHQVASGTVVIRFVQQSGYLVYATVYEWNVSIEQCVLHVYSNS